ncbi:phage holin family protein [Gloeobacter morelensis MG652769]|uniref:Phage holin family protein n=1 Tax=Gloeobacter morelensis MG652769 TaxID=2781736 RepID=A0ABY3PTT2_9CYAN|nr:phage holin family protein [Gloeobacter morelensis MG652769]
MRQSEPSLKDLLTELVGQFEQLVVQHIRLARQEFTADGQKLAFHAGGVVLGLLLLVLGMAFAGVALLVGLQLVLPTWAAAIVVALLFLSSGSVIAAGSMRNLKRNSPGRAIEEAQETITWLIRRK